MIVLPAVTKLKGFLLPQNQSQKPKETQQGFAAQEEEIYLRKWTKPGDRDKFVLKDLASLMASRGKII